MRFQFKIVYTSKVFNASIYKHMSVTDLIDFVNQEYREIFNIHTHYSIQIVEVGNNINGDAELAHPVEASQLTIGERFQDYTTLYIRPVHSITEEFIRRDDYSVQPTYLI